MIRTALVIAKAHRGPVLLATGLGLGGLLTLTAGALVPTFRAQAPMHLWALGPGALAMLSTAGSRSQVRDLEDDLRPRLWWARGLWAAALAVVFSVAMLPVEVRAGVGGIAPGTGLLVVLTLGVGTLTGAAWLVGALSVVAAMAFSATFLGEDPATRLLLTAGPGRLALTGFIAAVALGAFARYGPGRRDGGEAI